MGWYGGNHLNRKNLIAELTAGREQETGQPVHKVTTTALKHCYRGNSFSGVLWTVWEQKAVVNGEELSCDRWIGCDLLQYWRESSINLVPGWYYKPLDETMEPHALSCPLGYLDMVPESQFPDTTSAEWRASVRAYHETARQKIGHRRNLKNSSCVEG